MPRSGGYTHNAHRVLTEAARVRVSSRVRTGGVAIVREFS